MALQDARPRVSIVVALYNEEDNVAPLCAAIRETLDGWGQTYEVLLVVIWSLPVIGLFMQGLLRASVYGAVGTVSTILAYGMLLGLVSSKICSSGKIGTNRSKSGRRLASSGSRPLTASTLSSPKYFSVSFGGRTWPATRSPVRRPNRRIWLWLT